MGATSTAHESQDEAPHGSTSTHRSSMCVLPHFVSFIRLREHGSSEHVAYSYSGVPASDQMCRYFCQEVSFSRAGECLTTDARHARPGRAERQPHREGPEEKSLQRLRFSYPVGGERVWWLSPDVRRGAPTRSAQKSWRAHQPAVGSAVAPGLCQTPNELAVTSGGEGASFRSRLVLCYVRG